MKPSTQLKGPDPVQLGNRIRYERERRGWRGERLADRTGRSLSAIIQYERGTQIPPLGVLMRLAELFDTSVSDLLEEKQLQSDHPGR